MVGGAHSSKPRSITKRTHGEISSTLEKSMAVEDLEFKDALYRLMYHEKVTRNEKDNEANQRILDEILNLCVLHEQWKSLGECFVSIVDKLSCIQSSAQRFIQEIINNLDKIPTKGIRGDLITTLRNVCNGKLYLEREHVEVSKLLAIQYEGEGKITEAAEVLTDLKIEAYGLLNQREKVQFILLQMRLLIKSEQTDKAAILAKKIQLKFFEDPENEDLKIKFYDMKIELERWTSYLETSRYYHILSTCESLSEELRAKMIMNSAIFCALAPKCPEQIQFTELLVNNLSLKNEPIIWELLKQLTSKELISVIHLENLFKSALTQTKVMDQSTKFGKMCVTDLNQRLIEHNILTIAKYYSRINLSRMAELIETSVKKCEENIARLVSTGAMTARVDRFTGLVDFSTICIRDCVLNNWFEDVSRLMHNTNRASHHVQKELSLIAGELDDLEID